METKTKRIKQICNDLEDIDYIRKNYDFDNLSKEELDFLYKHISNAWLILSKCL